MSDFVNGLYEFGGALFLLLSVRRLWIDKQVRGVSIVPLTFFASWGLWNLYFYPSVNCWWSFAGGACLVSVNLFYVGMMWWYRNG